VQNTAVVRQKRVPSRI